MEISIPNTIRPDGLTIVCISDTHGQLHKMAESIPEADIVLHAGDSTRKGELKELKAFYKQFGSLPHAVKLFISGNHELSLDSGLWRNPRPQFLHQFFQAGSRDPSEYHNECVALVRSNLCSTGSIRYLQDETCTIHVESCGQRINVYGSPWQPKHFNMAFNIPRGAPLREVWERVPVDTDILLTHTPPANILDRINVGTHCGCEELFRVFEEGRIQPRVHAFGHIHENHGARYCGSSLFVNAATCDVGYKPVQQPITVFLPFDRSLPAVVIDQ